MKSGVLSSFLFIWVGLCLSGVLPDGVWSEWGYAQWGFVCLPDIQGSSETIGKLGKKTIYEDRKI